MNKRLFAFLTTVVCALCLTYPLEAKVVLRLGTLVPRGSTWHKIIQRMGADWKQATAGELTLRIYAGGTVGDESEMIRKMRIGQLQAAAISNAGLAEIDPRAYAVMLPMMFESYEEWDYVRQKVNPILEARLEEKGFIVLTWSDVGWVYFFSKEPLRRPDDLKKMKLAASATEPSSVNIFKWAGFNPVPITTVDMITGLQTGLIDVAYMPLILAEASQFYRQAKNMTDMKWAPLQGALVMHEQGWGRLTPEQQQAVLKIAEQVGEELKENIRLHEARSLQAMKSRGLEVWPVDGEALSEWRRAAENAYSQIRGKLVPADIFDQVQRLKNEFQAQ